MPHTTKTGVKRKADGLFEVHDSSNRKLKMHKRRSFAPSPEDSRTGTSNNGRNHKKLKTEKKKVAAPSRAKLETATDSDPIVESDTTEHSGEDDGESWPSDNEEQAEQHPQAAENLHTKGTNHREKDGGLIKASNSRESHAKQKTVAQERKAAKPNADSLARSKKLWERLRRKSHVPLEERKTLVAELFEIITGRVKDFVLKHDSVRVIQTALKYANKDQKRMIAKELQGEYKALAQSRYAKFLVGKILVHGDEEIRDLVVPEFYGHARRLINHPEASWILDDIYRGAATPVQKGLLLREWYGAEFALFRNEGDKADASDLKALLAKNPEKRKPILHSLHDLINQLIQKKTTGFTMLHDAMLQYFLNVAPGSEEAADFLELLKGDEEGDLLKNLAFTKSGARVVCLALAKSNAKDRKQILKTYKGTIQLLMFDPHGHRVLLTALDVVDDTVLTSKSIISEMFSQKTDSEDAHARIMSYATHLQARIPILYPFVEKAKSVLPEEDIKLLNEVHVLRSTTSKKDPETRRKEIVKAMSPFLLPFIAAKAEDLVQATLGPQFITEVLLGAEGDKEPALTALADLTHGSPEIQEALELPSVNRMFKTLVSGGHYNPRTKSIDLADPPLMFGNILYPRIAREVVNWAVGSNAFVIVSMLEALQFHHKAALETTLRENRASLQQALDADEEQTEDQGEDMGDDKGKKLVTAGRKGTVLILSKLS